MYFYSTEVCIYKSLKCFIAICKANVIKSLILSLGTQSVVSFPVSYNVMLTIVPTSSKYEPYLWCSRFMAKKLTIWQCNIY